MNSQVRPYRLEDRYEAEHGRVLLTAIQALARLPVEQLRRDQAAGLNTAALISGYPGSPLGGYDLEIARMKRQLPHLPIVHQPAVNEELGATAVMGSQLAAERPDAKYDGVVGIWYGKAPGLDRASDALRHGVFAGASSRGGAVVLVGDDPVAKSSTMPSSSDASLVDLHMPILYPGTVAECLELGLHAVAMSRASGLWSAMKIVTPVADGSATVDLPVLTQDIVMPTMEVNGTTWQCHPNAVFLGPRMVAVEREFREVRTKLAYQYGVQNGLNKVTVNPEDAWIGLVATGFTYYQMLEALRRLGLGTDRDLADAGIRILHLRMPVPFDTDVVRQFARGLDEVVVVEEKNATLEWLIKDALYAAAERPTVVGKTHENGDELMVSWGRLDADAIVGGLRTRLAKRLESRLSTPEHVLAKPKRELIPLTENRAPFFCAGCPHNWGTKVPDGTLVGAGTGCHGMSLLMDPERVGETIGITAMGNEGGQWIGMAPFVDTDHIVQNFGDGTYFHSGQLAVQAAIGAEVSVTFKILYNDTVAMTGGQEASHRIAVPELVATLLAHGVAKVMITTDDVGSYDRGSIPKGVEVWDRTRIVEAQEELAATEGVTILIHHQACAAELRRDRKRGLAETPTTRVLINHRICEGCGDCGDVSNCLSVEPVDTPLGRKTSINQLSCNVDYSCLNGDCPSFMTVEMNQKSSNPILSPPDVADPPLSDAAAGPVNIRMAGIGGTGVVTVAQILATAAMTDGWTVSGLDQTGLSQKAGPVISDISLIRGDNVQSNVIGTGGADVILAFDELVAASDGSLLAGADDRTRVIASTTVSPTGRMISSPDIEYPSGLRQRLEARSQTGRNHWVDATRLTQLLTGSPTSANVFLLGVGVQSGAVPVAIAAIHNAIRLNGVAVEANLAALDWGRSWVDDPVGVAASADAASPTIATDTMTVPELATALASRVGALDSSIVDLVTMLAADLVDYQDEGYAEQYVSIVERAHVAERSVRQQPFSFTESVARHLHKLMAYKDEYEVARLMLLPEARSEADGLAGPDAKVTWRLHPPMLRALGMKKKLKMPPLSTSAIKALRAGKRLRGKVYDPFGRAELRRLERELRDDYIDAVDTLIAELSTENIAVATEIAALPDSVRGYESLKARRAMAYQAELADALAAYVG
ncbi:MAG: indolepyruvate ferredoxin oxidoreductase family protein [Actinobacteria bacterium]|nr:indolepyruvate ferredoxin oxidoreductase family protein [Actinomycetota bacterium]